jgi:hypothetical protein
MTPRHVVLVGGLAVAGWLAFFGDKTPAGGDIAEPVARRPSAAAKPEQAAPRSAAMSASTPTAKAAKTISAPDILVLQPRGELIGGARAADTNALFVSQSWTPPPPPPPPKSEQKSEPEPAPTAPPLPFTYIGKKMEEGAWEVYLARGEQTYIVREKSVIDPMYRVESIKPPTLSVIYMPLNEIQTLTIGGAE